MSQKRRRGTQGFSMVEVLIAIGILGFVSVGVATLFNNVDSSISDAAVTEARDRVARDIETALLDLAQVTRSAQKGTDAETQALYKCLTPLDKSQRNKCQTEPRGFVMLGKGGAGRRIAGTSGNPVYYGKDGAPCVKGEACRFFRAETFFSATCLSAASNASERVLQGSCDQASSIQLQYQVTPLKALRGGRVLQPRPVNRSASSITHFITAQQRNQECPPFSKVSGHTPDGRVICRCIPGAIQESGTAQNDTIKCTYNGAICPAGEVWMGFTKNGSPDCRKRKRTCSKTTSSFCGDGGWVEAVNIGPCTATETTTKGYEYDVDCPDKGVTCCYYEAK